MSEHARKRTLGASSYTVLGAPYKKNLRQTVASVVSQNARKRSDVNRNSYMGKPSVLNGNSVVQLVKIVLQVKIAL